MVQNLYMSSIGCNELDDWLYTLSDICWVAGYRDVDETTSYYKPYTERETYTKLIAGGAVHYPELDPLAYLYRHTWDQGIFPREQVAVIETRLHDILKSMDYLTGAVGVLNNGTRRDLMYLWGVFNWAVQQDDIVLIIKEEPVKE